MSSRNENSRELAKAAEPSSLIEILTRAHWEIRCLLREMDKILETGTATFDLYPRIRWALEVHSLGEETALYEPLSTIPSLSELMFRSKSAHDEIELSLHRLDEYPWCQEPIQSEVWKAEFRALHRKVLAHMADEETQLFPELSRLLAPSWIEALGECYKRELSGYGRGN